MSPGASSSSSASDRDSCADELLAVRPLELDADLEAEVHDAAHLHLLGVAVRLAGELEVVRPHVRVRRAVLTAPTKLITNSFAGSS